MCAAGTFLTDNGSSQANALRIWVSLMQSIRERRAKRRNFTRTGENDPAAERDHRHHRRADRCSVSLLLWLVSSWRVATMDRDDGRLGMGIWVWCTVNAVDDAGAADEQIGK